MIYPSVVFRILISEKFIFNFRNKSWMLAPAPCKPHPPPVHFGQMGLTTTTHLEAVGQPAEGAGEDSIQSADSCFDPERVQNALITKHPMPWLLKCQTVTSIYLLFFFSLDPYTLRKHTQCLFLFSWQYI